MHIIVVGCGRLGSSLARESSDYGLDICIIDRNKEKLDVLGSGFNGQRINGVEFDKDNLIEAGIEHADALIAVTSDDNINITVSLIANKIYHVPHVISRVNDPNREHIYEMLNIETISPVQLGADLLINRLNVKHQDVILKLDSDYELLNILADKNNVSAVVGELERKYFCIISGLVQNGNFILPDKTQKIESGDRIICTIHKKNTAKLLRLLTKEELVWNR